MHMYEFILPNAWLIALLPFLAAALIFIFVHRWPGISAGLSIFAIMTSFVLSIPVALAVFAQEGGTVFEFSTRWLSMPGLNVDMGLLLDPLTAVMLIVVTSIALCTDIFSGYIERATLDLAATCHIKAPFSVAPLPCWDCGSNNFGQCSFFGNW